MMAASAYTRWNSYRDYLVAGYGEPVWRVGVDAGFSCPNRNPDRSGGCCYCDGTGASAAYQRTKESAWYHDSPFMERIASGPSCGPPAALSERLESISRQVEHGRAFLRRRYDARLMSLYLQAWTNTFAPIEELRTIYDAALSMGSWKEFIVSTRPDCVPEPVVDLLASYQGVVDRVWVELGLQSASDRTLERIGRGHDVSCFHDAAERLRRRGIGVCAHVILGLPGDDYDAFSLTASTINASGCEAVKIHNLHIPGGTRLYDSYLKGEVSCPSVRRHIEDTIYLLRRLRSDIVIERLVCETPAHRLAAPRDFADKSRFLALLHRTMVERDVRQGDMA
jgi:radical SAM protein (TIGR01212 family)